MWKVKILTKTMPVGIFMKRRESRKLFEAKIKRQPYYILTENGKVKLITHERPVLIEIFPSLECNLGCVFCDRGAEKSMLEDFNDIKVLYNNLSRDPEFHMLNFRISGKEPTLYLKVNELISFLHGLDPHAEIEFFTNAIELRKLTKKSISMIKLLVSIYPNTQKVLKKDKFIASLLKALGLSLNVNVNFHEDLMKHGKMRNGFDPLLNCFNPVLLCGTRQVYPCCRAHKFEQIYNKSYHFSIDVKNIYKKLKNVVKNTDLCSNCPRIYKDFNLIPV